MSRRTSDFYDVSVLTLCPEELSQGHLFYFHYTAAGGGTETKVRLLFICDWVTPPKESIQKGLVGGAEEGLTAINDPVLALG
jgi:hypothetical protein